MILLLGELLFSLVDIFITLCQPFPKVPNKRSWVLLSICGETPMYITLLKTAMWSTALRMLLLHSISWMLVMEDTQKLMDQSLFLLACTVVTLLRTSFLKFDPIFPTLRGNLTSGFLNVQFSLARMMMLIISTLTYWTCSLESKNLCKVLTLWWQTVQMRCRMQCLWSFKILLLLVAFHFHILHWRLALLWCCCAILILPMAFAMGPA